MKVGLSFSRCLVDIVDGRVDIEDVLVIISRTNFDPHDDGQWKQIWNGYRFGGRSEAVWANYEESQEDLFRQTTLALYTQGKLHQPRRFGSYRERLNFIWLETVLFDKDLESNPALKDAWETFQVMAGLTELNMNKQVGS
jgi:hypothetical protein